MFRKITAAFHVVIILYVLSRLSLDIMTYRYLKNKTAMCSAVREEAEKKQLAEKINALQHLLENPQIEEKEKRRISMLKKQLAGIE